HWKDDFSKYDMQLIFYTMFTAKRLLPVCQAVAHRTPSRLPGRDVPILIKDVIAVEQNEGDLSSKVKYQLKQHIDDFFDFFSELFSSSLFLVAAEVCLLRTDLGAWATGREVGRALTTNILF
uniref:Uncharacterized protein n=2 Tax=Parascaris univalens TaxID=6257 RepID=A0A915BAW6_PARUN